MGTLAGHPSGVDAKRGDHFLQADLTGLIPPWKPDSLRLGDESGVWTGTPPVTPERL